MKRLILETAVREIWQSCGGPMRGDESTIPRGRLPFFFIAGAGLSAPSIALAEAITEMCKKKALEDDYMASSVPTDPIGRYAHWLEKAYPSPMDRQNFFHQLIRKASISHATLRLVHLLESHKVGEIVVTPNFDDLVSRGLSLFGQDFLVCDHPAAASRIRPNRNDAIQLVHVHGTHWNYDICNLQHETGAAAREDGPHGMLGLMRNLLAQKSPLVIGYSGWEGEVIMTAIKERCQQTTWPYNLYWFCFDEASVGQLPDWLTEHENVRIVGPEIQEDSTDSIEDRSKYAESTMTRNQPEEDEATLTATEVIESMIRRFSLDAPRITTDPLGVYRARLVRSIPPRDSGEVAEFGFEAVLTQVDLAIESAKRKQAEDKQKPETELVAALQDAARRADGQEVIRSFEMLHQAGYLQALDPSLSETAASEIAQALMSTNATTPEYARLLKGLRSLAKAHPNHAAVRASLAMGLSNAQRSAVDDDRFTELGAMARANPGDSAVRGWLALRLTRAVTDSGRDTQRADELLGELRALAKTHTDDETVRDRFAAGLVAAVNNSAPNTDRSRGLLNELTKLALTNPDDAAVRARLIVGLTASISKSGSNTELASELLDQVRALERAYPDDPTLRARLAAALAAALHSSAESTDWARRLVAELCALNRSYPDDAAVRNRLAAGLVHAVNSGESNTEWVKDLLSLLRVIAEENPSESAYTESLARAYRVSLNKAVLADDHGWAADLIEALVPLRDAIESQPGLTNLLAKDIVDALALSVEEGDADTQTRINAACNAMSDG